LTWSDLVSDVSDFPDFADPQFLEAHVAQTLAFYDRRARDPRGGFFHCFRDDGTVYDTQTRHLVSSARFVVNYARAARRYPQRWDDIEFARHALHFLEAAHRQPNGTYAWELDGDRVSDGRVMAYGHAFVVLAAATALRAGLTEARSTLEHAWSVLEQHFWDETQGAYRDEIDATLQVVSPYRGQNANMHLVEAAIEAYKATGEARFLERAEALASKFAGDLADRSGGMIWEHYTADWQPDFDYNHDKPNDLFRPWGFQPGHQFEWARLLLTLDALRPRDWYLPRAIELYGNGMKHGADPIHGGAIYGFAPDGTIAAGEKYHWVHSEGFASAWRLYSRTSDDRYLADYRALWGFSWRHLVDHEYGAWFRVVTREGNKIDKLKSPPGKVDYHTLGACWDVLDHPAKSVG
jgi:mannose/cellobiose epimerase-like protein (N-acyl-D-glucosamine 2-epimerase family)